MGVVVQKYGGTSVANLDRIRRVADIIIKAKKKNKVVAVVSAMSGETNRLVKLASSLMDPPDERELDVIASSGEQVSSGLLAMALKSKRHEAVSYQGHQIRILTDNAYSKAKIKNIDSKNIKKALSDGKVVVVSGFQGVDEQGNVTTFGRGGSDLTAVALSSILNADSCELYKDDVDGIYTADPLVCKNARKIDKISYEEMLEMASLGSKVLQARAVEVAKKFNIKLHVRSTVKPQTEGTWVVEEEEAMDSIENVLVSGVAYDKNQAKITVTQVPDQPGVAAKLFSPLADKGISIDMIVQNISNNNLTDMTFTVPTADFKRSIEITKKVAKKLKAGDVIYDDKISKVSIVGIGMKTHSGVAQQTFNTLAEEGINIMMISTSEIKISCVIEEKYTELAIRSLHESFKLG